MDATSATSSAASSVDGGSRSGEYPNLGMFSGNASGGGTNDLLTGEGAFSLGNGFNNEAGSDTSFDLSDFPSLGGQPPNASAAGNGLAQALRQRQLLAQQELMQQGQQQQHQNSDKQNANLYRLAMTGSNGNFNMATEDFPALSSSAQGPGGLGSSSLLAGARAASGSAGPGLYGGAELESNDGGGTSGLLGGLSGLGGLRGLQQQPQQRGAGAIGSGSAAGNALNGDFGLLGLLGVIRMTDVDRNALALGSDLTLLGLNLGSTEQVYSTFSGPWTDGATAKEPHFQVRTVAAVAVCASFLLEFTNSLSPPCLFRFFSQLPACYYMQPPALKTGHLSKFQLETLFYIFYALPKDVLQAYASQELYTREWRYHGDLKLWFKRAEASSTSPTAQYFYFDINSWEQRVFNGTMNQNITNGFLPEDEVRVKFPSS